MNRPGERAASRVGGEPFSAVGSARVSAVAIVLLGFVQRQLKVTKSFKALWTTYTYNPAGGAYG